MNELPNEQQLFYSKDGASWQSSLDGTQWSEEKCKGYLHKHLSWIEFQATVNPPPTPEQEKEQRKKELASKRWEVATSGVIIDGVNVQSDDKSKDEMTAYVTESMTNGLLGINWDLGGGNFKVYTPQEFKKVFQIVTKYRNDCFGVQMSKIEEIENTGTTDLEVGWPSNTFTTV